jgi:small subunit ribosomal protein S2
MTQIDKMGVDGTLAILSKRERLQVSRQREKLDKVLGSIVDMTRLPAAIFIVDVRKEHIALAEAKKLKIPVFAIVDTNSDPRGVDFIIPANDDASKSIDLITRTLAEAVAEGLNERKADKVEADAKVQVREEAKAAAKAEAEAKAAEEAAAPAVEATPAKEGEVKPKRARKKATKVETTAAKVETPATEAKTEEKAEEKKD